MLGLGLVAAIRAAAVTHALLYATIRGNCSKVYTSPFGFVSIDNCTSVVHDFNSESTFCCEQVVHDWPDMNECAESTPVTSDDAHCAYLIYPAASAREGICCTTDTRAASTYALDLIWEDDFLLT